RLVSDWSSDVCSSDLIKQMGLTLGGVISALTLPPIASALGWRTAVATCAVVMAAPALASWPFLSPLARTRKTGSDGAVGNHWWRSEERRVGKERVGRR